METSEPLTRQQPRPLAGISRERVSSSSTAIPWAAQSSATRGGDGVEDRGDGGALAAAGDHLAVDPAAEGEPQPGDAERLPRAGLAGQRGEPGARARG